MRTAILLVSLFLTLPGFSAQKISVQETSALLQSKGALLFDVRELLELQQEGKAKGAIFFPKSSIDKEDEFYQEKLANLPKNKILIFYCRSGKRAEEVANKFGALGFTTRNMGAFKDWILAGYPVVNDVP